MRLLAPILLAVLVTLAAPALAQEPQHDSHAAGEPAAHQEAAHEEGAIDASAIFTGLFKHLEPHPVFAVWFAGPSPPWKVWEIKSISLVDPYPTDAAGQPLQMNHGEPVPFGSTVEFVDYYWAKRGPGAGLLIFNITTSQWIAAGIVLLVFLGIGMRARRIGAGAPRGVGFNLFESVVLFVRDDMVYTVMGKEAGRRFLPLFLTQFFFILAMNLMGLIYLGSVGGTATANLAVTGGMALTTLLWIHMSGIREHGFFHHWKNFVPHGIPLWVLPIIIPVEILGMLVKPAALTIRLFANMTAGHMVMLSFFGLIYMAGTLMFGIPSMLSFAFALGICGLELFVSFVQAYIFTYLSIVFIGASVHPEH